MSGMINRSMAMVGLSPNRSGPEARAARARANAYYGNQGNPGARPTRFAGRVAAMLLGQQQQSPASRKLLGG